MVVFYAVIGKAFMYSFGVTQFMLECALTRLSGYLHASLMTRVSTHSVPFQAQTFVREVSNKPLIKAVLATVCLDRSSL